MLNIETKAIWAAVTVNDNNEHKYSGWVALGQNCTAVTLQMSVVMALGTPESIAFGLRFRSLSADTTGYKCRRDEVIALTFDDVFVTTEQRELVTVIPEGATDVQPWYWGSGCSAGATFTINGNVVMRRDSTRLP